MTSVRRVGSFGWMISQTSWFRISGYRWTRTMRKPMIWGMVVKLAARRRFCWIPACAGMTVVSPMMMNRRSTKSEIFQSALYSSNVVSAVSELMRCAACWMSHRYVFGSCLKDRFSSVLHGCPEVRVFDVGEDHYVDGAVEEGLQFLGQVSAGLEQEKFVRVVELD